MLSMSRVSVLYGVCVMECLFVIGHSKWILFVHTRHWNPYRITSHEVMAIRRFACHSQARLLHEDRNQNVSLYALECMCVCIECRCVVDSVCSGRHQSARLCIAFMCVVCDCPQVCIVFSSLNCRNCTVFVYFPNNFCSTLSCL